MSKIVQKIGKVVIREVHNSYRLRFFYRGKDKSITISGGITPEILNLAIKSASDLNLDLAMGNVDETFAKYDIKYKNKINASRDLLVLWEYFKGQNKVSTQETTKKVHWSSFERALNTVLYGMTSLNDILNVIPKLLEHYSAHTVNNMVSHCLKPCLNLAYAHRKIDELPKLQKIKLPKQADNLEIFTENELYHIFEYFEKNISEYYEFIVLLAYTGRRPEDIIALQVKDIDLKKGIIDFNKAYSNGVLKCTKNNKRTLYNVSTLDVVMGILKNLINSFEDNKEILLFYSDTGGYIDLTTFSRKYWRPTLLKLVNEGKVTKYLSIYKLRHTRATQLLKSGIDIKTVASLLETSIKMLDKHYLACNNNVQLPRIIEI